MPNERQLFWTNLEKIRNGLEHSDTEFAQFIGLNNSHYVKCRKSLTYLPLDCIYELAEKLNFHFADLLKNDFKLLFKADNNRPVSHRYTVAPYSKMTPSLNIISYLEKTRGTQAKINLLRKLQLPESFLQDNNSTNIHLISDIVQYLGETYHFSENEFLSMGRQTPYSPAGKTLQEKLKGPNKDIVELLETFVYECAKYFDTNHDYQILDISNDFAIISSIPKKDVLEELKVKPDEFGNEEVCLTKMGCISSFSWFQFNRFARIEKFNSVYDGDANNKYIIDLAPFKKLSRAPSADILEFKSVYH